MVGDHVQHHEIDRGRDRDMSEAKRVRNARKQQQAAAQTGPLRVAGPRHSYRSRVPQVSQVLRGGGSRFIHGL